MPRYALIEAGIVRNVVEAAADWAAAQPLQAVLLADGDRAGPGWTYSNGTFSEPAPPAPVVPDRITRRQARQVLVLNGFSLAAIDAAISSLSEPTQTIARIFWEDSNDFERANATLNQMAGLLGISQPQLDLLFIAGSRL